MIGKHPLTGSRIRARRLDQGVRQADLAVGVGISPSYLNLIEHNRRRIAGKLLVDIAKALKVEPAALTEGADLALLEQMRSGAADVGITPETAKAEEMASRFPGWAAVLAAQARRVRDLEGQVQVLGDRMTHDPQLASAIHALVSAVTSIRSTAAILIGDDKLDSDWQRRFHQNIHNDSLRLATQTDALVAYFQKAADGGDDGPAVTSGAAQVEVAAMLAQIEADPQQDIAGIIRGNEAAIGPEEARKLHSTLSLRAHDAQALPLEAFADAARAARYDPAMLAAQTGAAVPLILRRLADLPAGADHPPMGFVACDGAGVITAYKPVPGFAMPQQGPGCPLWPLYTALSQPARPIRQVVTVPDATQSRLLCYAVAASIAGASFDSAPVVTSSMLVLPDAPDDGTPAAPVGQTCRICPRTSCPARRESSILGL